MVGNDGVLGRVMTVLAMGRDAKSSESLPFVKSMILISHADSALRRFLCQTCIHSMLYTKEVFLNLCPVALASLFVECRHYSLPSTLAVSPSSVTYCSVKGHVQRRICAACALPSISSIFISVRAGQAWPDMFDARLSLLSTRRQGEQYQPG